MIEYICFLDLTKLTIIYHNDILTTTAWSLYDHNLNLFSCVHGQPVRQPVDNLYEGAEAAAHTETHQSSHLEE